MRTYYKVCTDWSRVTAVTEMQKDIYHRRVVFTNGCFDILHMGHIHLLEKAKNLGDFLVVALNSDESVKKIKGDKRPIVPFDQRAYMIAALQCVDLVTVFDEETPYTLIYAIRPNILVKGGDWDFKNIVGSELVKSGDGEVHIINHEVGTSSTKIIEKIVSVYKES